MKNNLHQVAENIEHLAHSTRDLTRPAHEAFEQAGEDKHERQAIAGSGSISWWLRLQIHAANS